MKRNLVFVLLLTLFGTGASAQLKVGKLLKAGGNLISAVTLTDADIAEMSKSAVEKMDQENQVDTSDYHRRLQRLTENISVDGLKLNFKVYLTKDVNAFACGDGSVRVYSALMDTMSDSELMAIIGHEIGHVARTDTKDALKNAYLRSAAQNAAGFGQRAASPPDCPNRNWPSWRTRWRRPSIRRSRNTTPTSTDSSSA